MILEKQLAISASVNKEIHRTSQSSEAELSPEMSSKTQEFPISPLYYSQRWLQSKASSLPLCGTTANSNPAPCLIVRIQQESLAS